MYRDILVHVGGDAAARARLRLGAALAIRSGARLTGLHVRPPAHADPAPRRLLHEALERRGETLKARASPCWPRSDRRRALRMTRPRTGMARE